MTSSNAPDTDTKPHWLWWLVGAVGLLYFWGLDNIYMPTNGDEMVYAHIARLTAASGHWLPLVSELDDMRNTKPPLLFWQSMVVSGWGQYWHLWLLRLPSLLYLALVSIGMCLLLHRWLGEWKTAAWAVLCLLLCWGSFRYGRPYLTTAPEMFWYSLAPAYVCWRSAQAQHRVILNTPEEWLRWSVLGVLTGVGLAYKSFALVVPVALGVWVMRLLLQPPVTRRDLLVSVLQTAWLSVLALAFFACWLLIDPQPQEVWREFVQRENAGKLNDSQGYWAFLFSWRGSGDYLSAPLQNMGLLFPWCVGLIGVAWQHRQLRRQDWQGNLSAALFAWIVVWCVVFVLPSQRSSRYLLPVMPALAMLMALHVRSFHKAVSVSVAVLSLLMLSVLVWLGWHAHVLGLLPSPWWEMLCLCLLLVLGLCLRMSWLATAQALQGLFCAALALMGLNCLLHGMSAERTAFVGHESQRPHAETVWVPPGFNGEFERLQFLLPGANRFVPDQNKVNAFSDAIDRSSGAWFIVDRPADSPALLCETMQVCERIAVRWDIEQRLKPGQVNAANAGRPSEWLWRQEWLMRMR